MRIVGGRFRGRKLAEVGARKGNSRIRPSTDRSRESIFNILTNGVDGDLVTGNHVLDLFAGTGALGLEALSRGAESAVFVDSDSKAMSLLQKNIDLLGVGNRSTTLKCNATNLGHCRSPRADLVFLDPPYGRGLGGPALSSTVVGQWLAENAVLVWEEAGPEEVPADFEQFDLRRYGTSYIQFLRWKGQHVNG